MGAKLSRTGAARFSTATAPPAAGAAATLANVPGTDVPEASDSAGSNARTGASGFSVRKNVATGAASNSAKAPTAIR